jgi:hypothetical protein
LVVKTSDFILTLILRWRFSYRDVYREHKASDRWLCDCRKEVAFHLCWWLLLV